MITKSFPDKENMLDLQSSKLEVSVKKVKEIKMGNENDFGNNTETCSLSKKRRGEESHMTTVR